MFHSSGSELINSELIRAIQSKYGDNLTKLNLSSNNLRSLDNISKFQGIKELNLSCNQITDLSPLLGMLQLEELNLAENRINNVDALGGLNNLRVLDLKANMLDSVDEVVNALANMKKLEVLSLGGNPLCLQPSYSSQQVFRALHSLQWLDNIERPLHVSLSAANDVVTFGRDVEGYFGSPADMEHKLLSLQAQLVAMERAFAVQEKFLTQKHASAVASAEGREPATYVDVLQEWRRQTLRAMAEKALLNKQLKDAFDDKRKLRAQSSAQVEGLEAAALSATERVGALSSQVQALRQQLEEETQHRKVLSEKNEALRAQASSGEAAMKKIKLMIEESVSKFASSKEFLNISERSSLLLSLEGRLGSCAERVEVARSLVALKDVGARNTLAALEAERRLTGAAPPGLATLPSRSHMELRPEVEAVLSHLFRRSDAEGLGAASVAALLQIVSPEESNPLYATLSQAVGVSFISKLHSGLERRLASGRADVCWGELLLLLCPDARPELTESRAPLSSEDSAALERDRVWGDEEWARVELSLPPVDARGTEGRPSDPHTSTTVSAEVRRLARERAFLLKKCQEMQRTLERRAEGVKAHFANSLRLKDQSEQHRLSEISGLKERLKILETENTASEESFRNMLSALERKLEACQGDNRALQGRVDYLQSKEGMLIEKRIADEVAKYSKLETEHRLLKREHGKAEVRCKTLQRDVLRLQVSSVTSAEVAASIAAERQHFVDEVRSLQADKSALCQELEVSRGALRASEARATELQQSLEAAEREGSELREEVEKLASRLTTEAVSSGAPTASSVGGADLAMPAVHPAPRQEQAPSYMTAASGAISATPQRSADNISSNLDANIARLARLAEALLSSDEQYH